MQELTSKEIELLVKVYETSLKNRFGIAAVGRDEWAIANALVELELLEFYCLIDDRAWRLTEKGVALFARPQPTSEIPSGLLFSQRKSLADAAEQLCRASGWDINSVNLVTALDVLARSVK